MVKDKVSIVTPCYNEGPGVISFLQSLEHVLSKEVDYHFNLIVLDDCSYDDSLALLKEFQFKAPNISKHILSMPFNSGHQNSIYQGLLYTKTLDQNYVIVMDSDGEDDPNAIPLLLKKRDYDIVEVRRGKRRESLTFKLLYFFYRILFKIITGKYLNYGNYCMLKSHIVERIRHTSFIHLPAYLLKQKGKRTSILYNRSFRIDGQSKMGYKGLLLHAFKSLVEFGDDLLLWFLRLFGLISIMLVIAFSNLIYQKFIAHTAILGWFSTISLALINLAVLCIGFFVLGIIIINMMQQQSKGRQAVYSVIKQEEAE